MDLKQLAQKEAAAWEGSPYFTNAEKLTHIFWGERAIFVPLFRKLDLSRLVELACGFGRHAEWVMQHYGTEVQAYVCMDVLEQNVTHTRQRLAPYGDKVKVLKGDGVSFQPVRTDAVTAVFCYDAMVHFDARVVGAYLTDTFRILRPGGKALYHHSNYDRAPGSVFSRNPHARAHMSTNEFAPLVQGAGLKILEQVKIRWGNEADLDCVSLLEKS